jgi:hypothetical protein
VWNGAGAAIDPVQETVERHSSSGAGVRIGGEYDELPRMYGKARAMSSA